MFVFILVIALDIGIMSWAADQDDQAKAKVAAEQSKVKVKK